MREFTTSKLWVAGDTHGDVKDISALDQKAANEGVEIILQVGDFGIRWIQTPDKYFQKRARQKRNGAIWITVGGNHEHYANWLKLQKEQNYPELVELWPDVYWAPRPTLLKINDEKFLLMGGANSTDRHMRTEGVDWWREEEPTSEEMSNFFDLLQDEKPDVVVTHEAPSSVHLVSDRRLTRVAIDLDNIISLTDYMPTVWYYGHHHYSCTMKLGDTNFICCGMEQHYVEHGD